MTVSHYWIAGEEGEEIIIQENIRGHLFTFYSNKNLFSKDKVDKGTKLLAETMVLFEGQKVLDLGCGYGVLGIVAKKVCPECEVVLSDINEVAIKYSKKNAKVNDVDVKIVLSDLFENLNETFDNIITNPPFTRGKDIIKKWIEESYKHLNKPGLLQLVATKKFRYVESLLKKYFERFEIFNKKGDYVIYLAYKK